MAMQQIGIPARKVIAAIEKERAAAANSAAGIDAPALTRREAKGEQARAQATEGGTPRVGKGKVGGTEVPPKSCAAQEGNGDFGETSSMHVNADGTPRKGRTTLQSLPTIGRDMTVAHAAPHRVGRAPVTATVISLAMHRKGGGARLKSLAT